MHRVSQEPDLRELAEAIAPILQLILLQYPKSPPSLARYFHDSIDWLLRELPLTPTKASMNALATALELGVTSLAGIRYSQQSKFDPGRERLHWEHLVPISDIRRSLLRLKNPTTQEIIDIVSTYQIVWITKDENRVLKRNRRDDPFEEYRRNKIDLVDLFSNEGLAK